MISETQIHAETQGAAESAAKAWETTKEKAGEALHSGERYVRENPGVSTLGLLGAGFVVGVLVGWSVAHQPEPDYSTRVGKLVKNWSRKCSLD